MATGIEQVRAAADRLGWKVHEEDPGYMVVEFRAGQGRHYVRVRYDVRGRILTATADHRWLPDTGTLGAVLRKLQQHSRVGGLRGRSGNA